jgi:hypothetical protein
MSCNTNLTCTDNARLDLLRNTPGANGIADVEVVPHPFGTPLFERELRVYFYRNFPSTLTTNLAAFTFTGGERIPGVSIHVQSATGSGTQLKLTLDQGGDFSDYTIHIDDPSLDPQFNCYTFNFKVDCPRLADCEGPEPPPAPMPADPAIDYLAKDYNSFLLALEQFLPTRVPDFNESSEADLAITLAELFSYVGDQLSYYQDAVANEAWLASARQRLSAKRHARLVDYRVHDGLAARTVLFFEVVIPTTIPVGVAVSTNDPDPARRIIFETDETYRCLPELTAIQPWAWMGTDCCLPIGATQADLLGDLSVLQPGDLMLVEEILGPVPQPDGTVSWAPEAANPEHREVVRLKDIKLMNDLLAPGGGQKITRVTWDDRDALTWAACVVAAGNAVTIFRGNLLRASHGLTIANESVDPVTLTLEQGPLTWLYEGPPNSLFPPDAVNPREGVSTVQLTINGQPWHEQESLLSSEANDADFVVDTDDEGRGILRFGDGQLGQALPTSPTMIATYRVGNGIAGNVGRDTLIRAVTALPGGATSVRNPVAATGGIDPEPIEDVRRDAPQAFQAVQYRAVTAKDYADAAKLVPGVANAVAEFRWTGSWLTVYVAIDPDGRADLPPELISQVRKLLSVYRQAGYDLDIRPPEYVPLRIDLNICIAPGYFQADVLGRIRQTLTPGLKPDGTLGFFHPNLFTFGQSLYLSALYEAVQDLPGVTAVRATVFRPLLRAPNHELKNGEIPAGPFQTLRLDNDPSRPENGVLNLTPEGGL